MTTTLRLPRAETFSRLAIASVAAAFAVVGYLTAALGGQVDPIRDPVSDYEFHGAGAPLFVAAVLLLISGGLAVIAAMGHASLPRGRAVRVLFGLWCAGLSLVAVFPADRSASDPTVPGEIHWFGGAVYFTCLPAGGLLAAGPVAAWESAVEPGGAADPVVRGGGGGHGGGVRGLPVRPVAAGRPAGTPRARRGARPGGRAGAHRAAGRPMTTPVAILLAALGRPVSPVPRRTAQPVFVTLPAAAGTAGACPANRGHYGDLHAVTATALPDMA